MRKTAVTLAAWYSVLPPFPAWLIFIGGIASLFAVAKLAGWM